MGENERMNRMNGLNEWIRKETKNEQASICDYGDGSCFMGVCRDICMFDSFVFQKSWQGNESGSSQHDDDNKQTKQITHCERVVVVEHGKRHNSYNKHFCEHEHTT
jgi:hypothetical protein